MAVLGLHTPARADRATPPFDYARGAADRLTGTLGQGMARTGATRLLELPSVEAGVNGLVGIERATEPGLAHASAVVDVLQAAVLDPTAALCIRIAGDGLPNTVEGGGPVCQFLEGRPAAHRLDTLVRLDVYAEVARPRRVGAEVFLAFLAHPAETGATGAAARVLEIAFDPAPGG